MSREGRRWGENRGKWIKTGKEKNAQRKKRRRKKWQTTVSTITDKTGTATFLSKTSSTIKSVHLSLSWSIAFINRTMQLGGRQLLLVCHAITVQNSRTFCQMEAIRVRKQKMHKIRYGEYYGRMQIWTNTKPESNSICKYLSWFVLPRLCLADGWSS